jgi:hypothetical protein
MTVGLYHTAEFFAGFELTRVRSYSSAVLITAPADFDLTASGFLVVGRYR